MLQRIKIKLKPLNNTILEYNYSYSLSCMLYNKLKVSDVEFTSRYHKEGLRQNIENKNFKLLNPVLIFNNLTMCDEGVIVNKADEVELNIGGTDEVVMKIINGLIIDPICQIDSTQLKFNGFEYENLNKLGNNTLYKSLTPTITSIQENNKIKYIEIDDERYIELLKNNLMKKYKMLFNKEYDNGIDIKILNPEVAKRKFVKIKDNIHVIGYKKFDIVIKGNKDIQKVAYCCGIGINNMMGMGNLQMIRGDNFGKNL